MEKKGHLSEFKWMWHDCWCSEHLTNCWSVDFSTKTFLRFTENVLKKRNWPVVVSGWKCFVLLMARGDIARRLRAYRKVRVTKITVCYKQESFKEHVKPWCRATVAYHLECHRKVRLKFTPKLENRRLERFCIIWIEWSKSVMNG